MNLLAFYAVRGYTPDVLANLTETEKQFLHCARENYNEEEKEKNKEIFGEWR